MHLGSSRIRGCSRRFRDLAPTVDSFLPRVLAEILCLLAVGMQVVLDAVGRGLPGQGES